MERAADRCLRGAAPVQPCSRPDLDRGDGWRAGVDAGVVGHPGDARPALRVVRGPFLAGARLALSPHHPSHAGMGGGAARSGTARRTVDRDARDRDSGRPAARGDRRRLSPRARCDLDRRFQPDTADRAVARRLAARGGGPALLAPPQNLVPQGGSLPLCRGASAPGAVPARLHGGRAGGPAPDTRGRCGRDDIRRSERGRPRGAGAGRKLRHPHRGRVRSRSRCDAGCTMAQAALPCSGTALSPPSRDRRGSRRARR